MFRHVPKGGQKDAEVGSARQEVTKKAKEEIYRRSERLGATQPEKEQRTGLGEDSQEP